MADLTPFDNVPRGGDDIWSPGTPAGDILNAEAFGGGTTYEITVTGATLALTGSSASLFAGKRIAANPAALALTGASVSLRAGKRIAVTAASLTTTGASVSLRAGKRIAATVAALTLTGQSVTLSNPRTFTIVVLGPPPDGFTYWVEGGEYVFEAGDVVLLPTPGSVVRSLDLTGQSVTLRVEREINVTGASLTLTGQSVFLSKPTNPPLTATSATLALTGASVSLRAGRNIAAIPALVKLNANTVDLYGPDNPQPNSFDLQDLRRYRLRFIGEGVTSFGRRR